MMIYFLGPAHSYWCSSSELVGFDQCEQEAENLQGILSIFPSSVIGNSLCNHLFAMNNSIVI